MAKVNGIEELEEMKASAASHNAAIPNYNQWDRILKDFEELGVQSTGSFQGDLSLHSQLKAEAAQEVEKVQSEKSKETQQVQQKQPEEMTTTDKNQSIKANASSEITANYAKVFFNIDLS